jgi:hypothetical protein
MRKNSVRPELVEGLVFVVRQAHHERGMTHIKIKLVRYYYIVKLILIGLSLRAKRRNLGGIASSLRSSQ